LCCCGAGVTSTLAMFPLETVRTRLAVDHKTYRNVVTAFRLILSQEGPGALYRVSHDWAADMQMHSVVSCS